MEWEKAAHPPVTLPRPMFRISWAPRRCSGGPRLCPCLAPRRGEPGGRPRRDAAPPNAGGKPRVSSKASNVSRAVAVRRGPLCCRRRPCLSACTHFVLVADPAVAAAVSLVLRPVKVDDHGNARTPGSSLPQTTCSSQVVSPPSPNYPESIQRGPRGDRRSFSCSRGPKRTRQAGRPRKTQKVLRL